MKLLNRLNKISLPLLFIKQTIKLSKSAFPNTSLEESSVKDITQTKYILFFSVLSSMFKEKPFSSEVLLFVSVSAKIQKPISNSVYLQFAKYLKPNLMKSLKVSK